MSIIDAVRGMITTAKVVRAKAAAAAHVLIDTIAHRDDSTQYWQPYGFQAAPKPGAVAVQIAIGGHSDELFTIMVQDKRYTFALEEGEVVMRDDLGRYVWLKRAGLELEAPAIKLGASASAGVARVGDPVTLSADFIIWLAAVAAAAYAPSGPPAMPSVGATITAGSTKVRSE